MNYMDEIHTNPENNQSIYSDNSQNQLIIGETAQVHIEELNLSFLSRTDTGALITSLHAINLSIEDESDNMKDNVGKTIHFETHNGHHEWIKHKAKIVGIQRTRNAKGSEKRYLIEMTLSWQGQRKCIQVNLRDRAHMTYKLLLGRNFLEGMLIDIKKNEGIGSLD